MKLIPIKYSKFKVKLFNIQRTSYTILTAMCAVYLPRLSLFYRNQDFKKYNLLAEQALKLSLYFSIPGCIGIIEIADIMIPMFFGAAFRPAVHTTYILSALIVIFAIAYAAGHIILISANQEKNILIATCVGAITNFTLNVILIKTLRFNGAAIASFIAEAVVTCVLLYKAGRYVKYHIKNQFLFSILFPTLIMAIVIAIIRNIFESSAVIIISSIIIGSLTYIALSGILKNEIICAVAERVLNRKK